MSKKVAIKISTLEAIGEAVRGKDGSTDLIPVNALADRIKALPTASGDNKLARLIDGNMTELTADYFKDVTSIRIYAFYRLFNITKAVLPNHITKLGHNAFRYCEKLENITIGNGVTEIGEYCFADCKKLVSAYFAEDIKLKATGDYMFYNCSKLTTVNIPESVTTLTAWTFRNCSGLTNITIPNSVTKIESSVFNGCSGLTNITIPNSVTTIETSAFEGCTELTTVVLPSNLTRIDQALFSRCTKLTNLTIPASVTNVSGYGGALYIGSDTNKATIRFLGTQPPTISTSSFKIEYLEKIIVPKGYGDTYKSATNWANFADYIEEAAE